jgi:TPR repeat protein
MEKTEEEEIVQLMKRVEGKDAGAMCLLGHYHNQGHFGLLQDRTKAISLWKQAAELGSSRSHFYLGNIYHDGGDLKKAKFHFEVSAMAGHEVARCNLGVIESESGNMDRALKHWVIAASTGQCKAMDTFRRLYELQLPTNPNVRISFKQDEMSRDTFEATLAAYNKSCAEMRSEARDSFIRALSESI